MAITLRLTDRVLIERTIWRIDSMLWDLPRRGRRAIREELRVNLVAAAARQGARDAIHQLGDLRALAHEYLDAEYGSPGRRPRWVSGLYWSVAFELALITTSMVGFISFMDGAQAAGERATGTYPWGGWLGPFGMTGAVTLDNGRFSGFTFEVSLFFFVLPFLVFLLASRAWRAIPPWWRHRRAGRYRAGPTPT